MQIILIYNLYNYTYIINKRAKISLHFSRINNTVTNILYVTQSPFSRTREKRKKKSAFAGRRILSLFLYARFAF